MKKNKEKLDKFSDKLIVHTFVNQIINPYIDGSDERITPYLLIKSLTVIGKINKDDREYKLKQKQLKIDKFNSEIEDITYDGEPEL